jgi:hypothetical protein
VTTLAERDAAVVERVPPRLIAWLTAPAPAQRLHTVRIATLGYALVWIVVRTDHWRDLARLPERRWSPVGVAGWLVGPPSPATVTAVAIATFVTGAAAVSGRRWTVAGPLFALGFLWLTTFAASWGQILHTEQLPALHLLVLACAPSGRGDSTTAGWPLRVMTLVTAATYVVAGIAKFRFGGGWDWLDGDRLLRLVAHDNLRKRLLGDPYSPLAAHVVGHPWVFRVGVWLTVLVELGAVVVVVGRRRLRIAWIVLAWLFHAGVLALMAVFFPYPLLGFAFASMLPVERLTAAGRYPGAAAPDVRGSG